MKSSYDIVMSFRLNRSWKQVALATVLGVVFYQLINLLRPNYGNLQPLFAGNVWAYVKDLFGYYLCFEWISVFLFMKIGLVYSKWFNLRVLSRGWGSLFWYNLKYLPVIFLSIFLFAPLTNGLRYLVLQFPDYAWEVYYPEYFMTMKMYTRYLVPMFFLGLGYLNYNVFLDFNDWQTQRFKDKLKAMSGNEESFLKQIKVFDNEGETVLDVQKVIWMEVTQKSYCVHTAVRAFKTKFTIAELEERLNPNIFFRINRSTIINLKHFKNYSFWEYDKYIVRLDDNKTEFVMQRSRLKDFKEVLNL